MQVACSIALQFTLAWSAAGVATILMTPSWVSDFIDARTRRSIDKPGRLPSFLSDVVAIAAAIITWPVEFGRLCR